MQGLQDIDVTQMMPIDMSLPSIETSYKSNVSPDQLESLTDYIEMLFNQYGIVNSDQVALDLRRRYMVCRYA